MTKTIYDLSSLYRVSKDDDMKMRLIIDEMESMVKNIRVLPISTVFNSFSRMVRDIANEKGKDIDFEIEGKDTCADKKIIEEIKTPLIHILRNAIDHGIETKEERIANGKNPVGKADPAQSFPTGPQPGCACFLHSGTDGCSSAARTVPPVY